MSNFIAARFMNSESAGKAVSDLKNQGFTQDISVISRNYEDTEGHAHNVKRDVSQGAKGGAALGAAAGGAAALLAGLSTITLPGVGVVIAGTMASTLAAAAGGAAAGGVVGALADEGISDAQAKSLEDRVMAGDVVVTVTADDNKEGQVENILSAYGADEIIVATNEM